MSERDGRVPITLLQVTIVIGGIFAIVTFMLSTQQRLDVRIAEAFFSYIRGVVVVFALYGTHALIRFLLTTK